LILKKSGAFRELMDVTAPKTWAATHRSWNGAVRAVCWIPSPKSRAKQFVDAFVVRFQKHFDADSLNERVIPLRQIPNAEDLQGLLDYYRSPLGQRMLKVLPEVTRESQRQVSRWARSCPGDNG